MSTSKNHRNFLVTLTHSTADELEDLKIHLQRKERRRVTKRELVEAAIKSFVAQSTGR
jgi:hypothetical protein